MSVVWNILSYDYVNARENTLTDEARITHQYKFSFAWTRSIDLRLSACIIDAALNNCYQLHLTCDLSCQLVSLKWKITSDSGFCTIITKFVACYEKWLAQYREHLLMLFVKEQKGH